MHWVAPSEKDATNGTLEKKLWDAADQFRANSGLKSQEYSAPVLGLIFLRFAEVRFAAQRAKLKLPSPSGRGAGGEGGARLTERIAAMFESMSVLSSKLSNLRRTRDLLLPRLLSGQVNIKEN